MRALSRLFRRLFLDRLLAASCRGPGFFGELESPAQTDAFTAWLTPFRKSEQVVHSKPLFGGPEAVRA